jgi:ligand-binding sensor domain-containing protein
MRKYIFGVIFFLIAGSVISFGQNNWISLKFNHLTTKNGLSNSEISCIVQDRFGYIWFGTMDGLNRYDGYKFKVYKRISAQPGVLTDNIIKTLHLDKKGRLWIGTSRGISRYNENQDDFTNFIFDTININNGRINQVNAFINDSYGNLITCSEGGTLYRFNDQKQKMEVLKTPNFGIVKYMIADEFDNVFLIGNSGLFCYNLRSGKLQHFYHESLEKFIPSDQLTCLCLNNQKLWIGTVDKGIFIFDTKTFDIKKIETDNPGHQTIQCIKRDINGDIWVGDFAGLRLFPKGGYKSFDYYHAGDDLRSLGGSGINYN